VAAPSSRRILRELLNAYWLRPETALWRSLDIHAMRAFSFRSPSLDLGCGDGLFSFIRAGGRLDSSFDAFQSVASMERFFKNADVYDSAAAVSPKVAGRPSYRIDVGFDHKPNLLAKAAGLGFYRSLKHGDANKRLPFADASFKTVFSNIVYWLDEPDRVFAEINRILRPGGRCCLMLPNETLPQFSFYQRYYASTKDRRFKFLELLDRGRLSDNIKQAKSEAQWRKIIARAGLTVISRSGHLSKTTVEMWDIGLRPLFPVLHKMAFGLSRGNRAVIKKEWVDTFENFLAPMAALDADLNRGHAPAFHRFILGKKN
jgi:SAM-dependent methyltransferase